MDRNSFYERLCYMQHLRAATVVGQSRKKLSDYINFVFLPYVLY